MNDVNVDESKGVRIMPRTPPRTPIRRWIDDLAVGKRIKVWMLTDVNRVMGVYLVPSESELGAFYTVVEYVNSKGKTYWVCQCKGYRFSEKDHCKHVKALENTEPKIRWAFPKLHKR